MGDGRWLAVAFFRTLRWRLLLAFFAAILVSALVTGGLTLASMGRAFLTERSRSALMSANMVANSVRPLMGTGPSADLEATVRRLGQQLGARVLVTDAQGRVLADQYGQLDGETLAHPEVRSALSGHSETAVRRLADGQALYAAVPVYAGLEVTGVVLLAFDLVPLEAMLAAMARRLVLACLAGGTLAAVGGYILAVLLARPLGALARAARALAEGRLSTRAPVGGSEELAEVARAFNRMAERLEDEDRLRRLFISNAAHELRSPLASIKVLAQAIIDDPGADLELYREFLRDIDREVDRLARLGDALLDLTRFQQRGKLQLRPVPVLEAVHEACERLALAAQARGVEVTVEVPPGLHWDLEPSWFATLVHNLLHNAVKYAPEAGGRVAVGAAAGPAGLVLTVDDDGEGIPPEHQPHLFEHFYRVDSARARQTGGVGLGLAIVREIAAAHGGHVTLESRPGHTRLTVTFPPPGPGRPAPA